MDATAPDRLSMDVTGMDRFRTRAICVASILGICPAMMLHETAHVVTGWLAGGSPTLMTATEVQGDWGSLTPAGFVALGLSGTMMNVVLCIAGWRILSRKPETVELRLTGWFVFAVNGMLLSTKMVGEAISGFGDWMTILRPFADPTCPRVVVTILGFSGVALMVRTAGPELARLIAPGTPGDRTRQALRIIFVGAAVSAVVVTGSSVANPIGTTRGVLLALGAGLSPLLPMLIAVRFVRKVPPSTVPRVDGGWSWLVAAGATVATMWFVYGPGIRV